MSHDNKHFVMKRNGGQSIRFLDEILFSLSLKVSKIDASLAAQIHNALAIGFENPNEIISRLSALSPKEEMRLIHSAEHNEVVSGRVMLDTITCACPVTHVKMKPISFDNNLRLELYENVLSLAKDYYAKSPEYKSSDNVDRAAMELQKFTKWLQQ